jgi:hypothetical protein
VTWAFCTLEMLLMRHFFFLIFPPEHWQRCDDISMIGERNASFGFSIPDSGAFLLHENFRFCVWDKIK